MSSDESFAPLVCKQCGTPLVGPSGEDHAQPNEIVSCPVHGPVGRLQDLLQSAGPEATRQIADQIGDLLKGFGFDVDRE